jgi:hypothetical protein
MTPPKPPRFRFSAFPLATGWCWSLWKGNICVTDGEPRTYKTRAAALRAGRREIGRTK